MNTWQIRELDETRVHKDYIENEREWVLLYNEENGKGVLKCKNDDRKIWFYYKEIKQHLIENGMKHITVGQFKYLILNHPRLFPYDIIDEDTFEFWGGQ